VPEISIGVIAATSLLSLMLIYLA